MQRTHGRTAADQVARRGRTGLKVAIGGATVVAAAAVVIVATHRDTQRGSSGRPTESASATSAAAGPAAAAGETLTGTVAQNSSTTFPFTSGAGVVSYFAAAPGCSATGLQWVVEDSAGTPLTGAAVICGDIGRVEFATAGDYRVRVYSDGTPGGGKFSVIREESRPDRVLAISSGQSVKGNIDLPGAQDIYEFEPAAGAVAYFASGDCETSGLQWVVEDAAGAPATGAAVVCNDIGRADFPTSGHYRVRVYSVGGATGTYEVHWKTSRADRALAIISGQTVEGDIDLPGAQDLYTFDVDGGTVAYFAASADCTRNDRFWVVENDAGGPISSTSVICGDIGRVVFSTAGRYHLRVYSVDGGTGRYGVTWSTSRPDKKRVLTFGSPASGTIDVPGSHDIWTFSAGPAESVTLTAGANCDSTDLRWVLLASDGTAITVPHVMCDDIGTVALPSAGEYQIVVSADGPATGNYTFSADAG